MGRGGGDVGYFGSTATALCAGLGRGGTGADADGLLTSGGSGGKSTGAAGWSLGDRVPGGAASATGAPHTSQKSPAKSKGLRQKRHSATPGWVECFSNEAFNNSSSISTRSRPRLGRERSSGAPVRGAITGEGEIFNAIVDCGVGRGRRARSTGAAADVWGGWPGGGPRVTGPGGGAEGAGAVPSGVLAFVALISTEPTSAMGVPHWRQKRIPSGTAA